MREKHKENRNNLRPSKAEDVYQVKVGNAVVDVELPFVIGVFCSPQW